VRPTPRTIEQSRRYLRDFTRIVRQRETVEDIVAAMLELQGTGTTLGCCGTGAREAVAKPQG
jgi:hypothetical protein